MRRLRDRLLGEHLGAAPGAVRAAIATRGSLLGAVEALRGGARSLAPLDGEVSEWADRLVPAAAVLDPERPVDFETLRRDFISGDEVDESEGAGRASPWRLAAGVALLAGLAALWRFTPLGDQVAPGRLTELAAPLRGDPVGPLIAVGGFVVAALGMVPVTALIAATALVFGWAVGSVAAFAGALLSALAGYAIGRLLWRDAVRRIAGRRLERLSRALAQRGVLAVAALRLVPVAPFAVVNLAAGATHIRFRDFALGTALGMAPGTLVLALVADRAAAALLDPGVATPPRRGGRRRRPARGRLVGARQAARPGGRRR